MSTDVRLDELFPELHEESSSQDDAPHPLDVFLDALHGLSASDMDNLTACWGHGAAGTDFAMAWADAAHLLRSVRFTKHIYEVIPARYEGARQAMIAFFMATVLEGELSEDSRHVLMRPWYLHCKTRLQLT